MPARVLVLRPSHGWVLLLSACAGAPQEPAPPPPPPPPSAPPAPSPTALTEAPEPVSDAAAADASPGPEPETKAAEPAPKALRIKGARACTAEEIEREWCAEGKKAGRCIEGSCVTFAVCGSYCDSVAEREHAGCGGEEPPDCAKTPECAKHSRLIQAECAKARATTAKHCRSTACAEIAKMPPPPPG